MLEPVEVGDHDQARHDGEAFSAVAVRVAEVVGDPAQGARPGRAPGEGGTAAPRLENRPPDGCAGQGARQVARVPSGEVHEAGSVDLGGQVGALCIVPVEHGKRDRLDPHGLVVGGAEVEPVLDARGSFLRGGGREEHGPLRAPGEQLGVDGDHLGEELTASHKGNGPLGLEVAHGTHGVGPDWLGIRFTLVGRVIAQASFEVTQAVERAVPPHRPGSNKTGPP